MDEQSRLQSAPLAVIVVDRGLAVTGWNRRAEQIFKKAAAEVIGRGLTEILPLAGETARWQAILDAAEGETP